MLLVEVIRVVYFKDDFVVLLRGDGDERILPIQVEQGQAHAIQLRLGEAEFPRPLTHDLFKTVMDTVGCKLLRVEICELREHTFFARVIVDHNGVQHELDARPSDAIALALRCAAPIHVAEEVMDGAGVILSDGNEKSGKHGEPSVDALEKKLQKAVDEERYEDAAGFRDEISRLKDTEKSN